MSNKILFEYKTETQTYVIKKKSLKESQYSTPLKYLLYSDEDNTNVERKDLAETHDKHSALKYTLRALDHLETINFPDGLRTEYDKEFFREIIMWMDCSKGGTAKQRKEWKKRGYPLDIHNIVSAELYKEYASENTHCISIEKFILKYTLIYTHGMIGQYLRGEINIRDMFPLTKLVGDGIILGAQLKYVLSIYNECIIYGIEGMSIEEKEGIINRSKDVIHEISNGSYIINRLENDVKTRLSIMLYRSCNIPEDIYHDLSMLFMKCQIWYPYAALHDFSDSTIMNLFRYIIKNVALYNVDYISFYRLSKELYYDQDGVKTINIYKKRMIENMLSSKTYCTEHCSFKPIHENSALHLFVEFSEVANKLLDFCIAAERSNILNYYQCIDLIYSKLGLKLDNLDRLGNETKYLTTMDKCENSTKSDIITRLKDLDKKFIVDVGFGSGVLIKQAILKIEDSQVLGLDISSSVISSYTLGNEFYNSNKDRVSVMQHDLSRNILSYEFTDKETNEKQKPDAIIFSSILHEIYSFNNFDINVVKKCLRNAYDSLQDGGVIIIRDGVKTEYDDDMFATVMIEDDNANIADMVTTYRNFYKGSGFPMYGDIEYSKVSTNQYLLKGPVENIKEFLYTYTWGEDSFPYELKERFGWTKLKDIVEFAHLELGMNVIENKAYIEQGYIDHLKDGVKLMKLFERKSSYALTDLMWDDIPSTMFLIFQK